MMKQLLFLVINFILLSNFCESRIFDSATINTSTCKGSLVFKQGNGKLLTLSGDMNVTKIYVESVSMQGCGCYQVFSGRYGKVWFIPSQSKKETKNSCQFFINVFYEKECYFKGAKACIHNGRKLTKHELGFRKVKSIFKVKCWNYQSFLQDLSWKTKTIIFNITHYQSYCKEKVLLFVTCTTFQHKGPKCLFCLKRRTVDKNGFRDILIIIQKWFRISPSGWSFIKGYKWYLNCS